MLQRLLALFRFVQSRSDNAGSFFPPEYKRFAFKEGDLLASKDTDGKFSVNKILKVDRFDLKKGASISIQGEVFVATEDDYLLIVSTSYGEAEFNSLEEARAAARTGKWTVALAHAPNRPPGAEVGRIQVSHSSVLEHELVGYRFWREAFNKGEAGVY